MIFGTEIQKIFFSIIYYYKLTRKAVVADIQFFQRNKMKKWCNFCQAENKKNTIHKIFKLERP